MEKTTLTPGTVLGGRFRIVRFISSGGFGCTYEAVHTTLGKRFAIKEFFVSDYCNRDEATGYVSVGTTSKKPLVEKLRRKFIEEATSQSLMEHRGIVRVTDVFEENGTAYYVMEYIDGESLSQMLRRRGYIPEHEAVGYILQVADALAYVHSQNRLHLDIKPGNIMVDGRGRAVLIDFGASKQYDEVNGENTSTLMGLTPGYASPEQMGKDVKKFLPATDIYSLGATFYKLLTGVTPPDCSYRFSGDAVAPLPSHISASTRRAVEAALTLNRFDRPQTIGEFLALLDVSAPMADDMEETVVAETASDNAQQSSKPSKSHTKLYLIIGLILVAGILVGLIGVGLSRSTSKESEVELLSDKDSDSGFGEINGHEYVDLGLSVKWATQNVENPDNPSGWRWAVGGVAASKMVDSEVVDSEIVDSILDRKIYEMIGDISGTDYDVARYLWGSPWRMPTRSELDELMTECEWTWTGGGYEVKGKNGNRIFLQSEKNGSGYWSSTKDGESSVYYMFLKNSYYSGFNGDTYDERYVRPVSN